MCPQPTHEDPGLDLGEHGTLHTTDHDIRVLVDTEHVRIAMSVTTTSLMHVSHNQPVIRNVYISLKASS